MRYLIKYNEEMDEKDPIDILDDILVYREKFWNIIDKPNKKHIELILKKLENENPTMRNDWLIWAVDLKKNIKSNFKSLNRQMQNNWNLQTFIHLLEYKCKLKGNQVIKVNEAWTSKTCCKCGSINHDLDLMDRQYICDCGNNINRDINGAINIYKQFMGDYNPPFETLIVSERFDWCHVNQMNKNYKFYNNYLIYCLLYYTEASFILEASIKKRIDHHENEIYKLKNIL